MRLRIQSNQMEEVEGLQNEYPYVFHHVDLRETPIPWHWHEAIEFCYIQSGVVNVATAGQSRIFKQGEGFFINSNVLTAMTNVDCCVMDSHLFHPIFLSGHFKSIFETKYMNPILQNKHLDLLPIRGETALQANLLEKLQQLSLLQSQQNVEFQTRNCLSEIWLLLLEEAKTVKHTTPGAKNQDRILTMLAFIQDNYDQKLTLQEIADASSVSTRECLRCFQMSIHQSPMEYLIEYRIQVATKLLETTTLSISEIAMRTGWESNSYFSKMFRKLRGKAPNAYRKEYLTIQKGASSE